MATDLTTTNLFLGVTPHVVTQWRDRGNSQAAVTSSPASAAAQIAVNPARPSHHATTSRSATAVATSSGAHHAIVKRARVLSGDSMSFPLSPKMARPR